MATDRIAEVDAYLEAHLEESLEELARLCRQPSVAAQGLGLAECAELTATMLREHGFRAEVLPTAGAPVVYGEAEGASDRTLLFYNHYDVQPVEPLELWDSPPFEPARRDGRLYARGVNDDKGHIVSRLAAIRALRAVHGQLPCRVKFVIEGEEEIGSTNLPAFVEANRDLLRADGCIWEFGLVNYEGAPVTYLGTRGIFYVELSARTLSHDAHSGLGGSIFPNAAWRLVWALATLKGPDERIRIAGSRASSSRPLGARPRTAGAAAGRGGAPEGSLRPRGLPRRRHRRRVAAPGGLRADLHHLGADGRLPGSRLEDGPAGDRQRED